MQMQFYVMTRTRAHWTIQFVDCCIVHSAIVTYTGIEGESSSRSNNNNTKIIKIKIHTDNYITYRLCDYTDGKVTTKLHTKVTRDDDVTDSYSLRESVRAWRNSR